MLAEKLINEIHKIISELKTSTEPNIKFRINSYLKVVTQIESNLLPEIEVNNKIIDRLLITDYMKNKLKSIIKDKTKDKSTDKTKDKTKDKNTDKPTDKTKDINTEQLIKDLILIHGIGMERAKQLISDGLTSVNQLKTKKFYLTLPEETKAFLKLKPKKEIPNINIKKLEPMILSLSDNNSKITLVGSYRRKKPVSSDIDVMVVSDDTDAINKFLSKLNKTFSSVYPYSKGQDKLSVIIDVSNVLNEKNLSYKLDAFRVNKNEEIPMLLYSTGSKLFNITMRSKAKKNGYLLNQHGLFRNGSLITGLNSEEDYFKILQMDYLKPEERL